MIFLLMGKSGSGKDTILNIIKDRVEIKVLTPFTTRPMRYGEAEGIEYNFLSKKEINDLIKDDLLECRDYDVNGDVWTYGFMKQNVDSTTDYIAVTTLGGYNNFIEYYGSNNVCGIYIYVEEEERIERCINRELNNINTNFKEMMRRLEADEFDFSYEKLFDSKIVNLVENSSIEDCCEKILKFIRGQNV